MSIKQAYLMLSEDCNLNCKYCFEHKKKNSNMSEEVLKKSFDFITKNEISTVILFGGEPTLNCDGVNSSLDYFEKESIVLITNGVETNKETLEKIRHKKNVIVQVSLDGNYETMKDRVSNRDQFNNILENMKKYQEVLDEQNFRCHMTLTKNNIYSLYENFMFLVSLSVTNIQTTLNANDDYSDDDILIYRSQLEMISNYMLDHNNIYFKPIKSCYDDDIIHFCGTGESFICINSIGDIYPCPRMYTNFKDKYKMGDIYQGIINRYDLNLNKHTNKCSTCENKKCIVCVSANLEKYNDINICNEKFCNASRVNDYIYNSHKEKDKLVVRDNDDLNVLQKIYKENQYIRKIKNLQIVINDETYEITQDILDKMILFLNFKNNCDCFEQTNINFIGNNIEQSYVDIIVPFIENIKSLGYNGKFSIITNIESLNSDIIESLIKYDFNVRLNIDGKLNSEASINFIRQFINLKYNKVEVNLLYSKNTIYNLYDTIDFINDLGIKNIQFNCKDILKDNEINILKEQLTKILKLYLNNKQLKIFIIDKIIYQKLNPNIKVDNKEIINANNFSFILNYNGEFLVNYNFDKYEIGNVFEGINFNKLDNVNKLDNIKNESIEVSIINNIVNEWMEG